MPEKRAPTVMPQKVGAERNGGVNGFYGTLDLRLAKKFKTYKKQNLEVSVDIFI
jgi:hypothetical protein